jgi:uncharacterized oxidoreductase
MIRIDANRLRRFTSEIFIGHSVAPEEARRIAHYLVEANLAGHDSHGVIRVPLYMRWKKEGVVVAGQRMTTIVDLPALALVDGGFGFGQTIAPQAVQLGMAKARAGGVALVGLRNCGHVGRVGDWAEMAAAENLVSVHFVNAAGSVLVAPFGGTERRLSTAPFCVGIPRGDATPVVLDFATSLVAEGKVLVASRGGKPLPLGALINRGGGFSEDPTLLYGVHTPDGPRDHSLGEGAIRAFGEHKGSGLALICELLAGALTGNGATEPNRRFSNGMLSLYVDPLRLDPEHVFGPEVARYIAYFKSAQPAEADGEVLVPGEPEAHSRLQRLAHGVPLPRNVWRAICQTAEEAGLDIPSVD